MHLVIKTTCMLLGLVFAFSFFSCKKEPPPDFTPKIVSYLVTGSNFRLNFIDSNMAFQRDRNFSGSFLYEFRKAPGTNIGISIFKSSPADSITSWRLSIDGKLYANGFSEGGAYMQIPYN
jgi:hypothetical protein